MRTLGDLSYRDGTQQLISTERGRDLTMDGRNIWMTSMESNRLMFIDHRAPSGSQVDMVPIPFDQNARLIEYDGRGSLILTTSMANDSTDLDLYLMDAKKREIKRLVYLANVDSGILQSADHLGVDFSFIWLSLPYVGDINVSMMVVLNLGTFEIEALQPFPRIRRFCFDGRHMWVVSRYTYDTAPGNPISISYFFKYRVSPEGFEYVNLIGRSGGGR